MVFYDSRKVLRQGLTECVVPSIINIIEMNNRNRSSKASLYFISKGCLASACRPINSNEMRAFSPG